MDRIISYVDALPLIEDILNSEKNTMIALGMALQAILGTGTVVDGLPCTPTGPASLQVLVGQGSIYAQENVDSTAYGPLGSDTAHQIVKQGINYGTKTLTLAVPGTTGQSINYLIEVAYQDTDTGSTVLPYYNSSNPAVAYNGPANSGTSQNTIRQGQCVIQAKAGVAATTGSQTTPAPDAGFTGLWVVTVANGTTAITSGMIALAPNAPFIPYKLPNIPLRTRLTANTSFYVSTTGNDSNNGLSSTTPWLTMNHALSVIQNNYDLAGFVATISLTAGTYTENVNVSGPFTGATGSGSVVILGNTGSPASYMSTVGSGINFQANSGAQITVSGIQMSGGTTCLLAQGVGAHISFGNVVFGAASSSHISAGTSAIVDCIGNYTISGNAPVHATAGNVGAFVAINTYTVTLTGTPAFSTSFAHAESLAEVEFTSNTFTGSATGARYTVVSNGVVNTQGSGATYLPGNSSGTTATGGQYV